MAKVTGLHQSPRAPSMRRAVVFSPGPSGMVARAWPINGKRRLSPKQQEAVEKFREAALIAKYAPAADQMRSRELAHGSQFLPRDLQYMAIFGRLCTLFFTNGQRRYQLASRYDLTELLDILGFEPGSILYRGEEFWEVLPPGFEGAAIVWEDGRPVWGVPGGGGSGGGGGAPIMALNGLTLQQGNYATKGSVIIPRTDFWIDAIGCVTDGSSVSPEKRATIARLDGIGDDAAILDLVAVGPWDADTNTSSHVQYLPLANPIMLLEGERYLLGVTWNASSDTSALRLYYGTSPTGAIWFGSPADSVEGAYYYRSRSLSVSDKPNVTGSLTFSIWPRQVTDE